MMDDGWSFIKFLGIFVSPKLSRYLRRHYESCTFSAEIVLKNEGEESSKYKRVRLTISENAETQITSSNYISVF